MTALGKRSLNEQSSVEYKRAISIPSVGINSSLFEGFESKLTLLDSNIVAPGKLIFLVCKFFT